VIRILASSGDWQSAEPATRNANSATKARFIVLVHNILALPVESKKDKLLARYTKYLSSVSIITPQQLEMLLPLACAWAVGQERAIVQSGVALNESQLADARRVGVAQPERVRLLRVAQIPVPTAPALAAAARATNLINPLTHGLTLRYGIFIRADCWNQRPLVVHELIHTSQYERLGGFEGFLRPYLLECITPPGYPYGPMEQEAITTAARLCA
jgi:hypothetical protein